MTSIQAVIQSSRPGERVSLFRLDAAAAGGGLLYFTPAVREKDVDGNLIPTEQVIFGGTTYTPVDVEFQGFEISAGGSLPTPTMRLANTDGMWQALLNTYGDLCGCTIQRVRTFRRFLDGEVDADPSTYLGPDTFRIERKKAENKSFIEWELSAAIDQEGKKLPGRVVIRDTCLWRYRRWDPDLGAFDYSKAQCPFAGAGSYDINDQPTTPDKDVPSRRLSCCETRFGSAAPLPFGGFPGAARLQQ